MRPSRKRPLYRGFSVRQRAHAERVPSWHELHTHSDLSSFTRATVARRRTKAEMNRGRKGRRTESPARRRLIHKPAILEPGVETNAASDAGPAVQTLTEGLWRMQLSQLPPGRALQQPRGAVARPRPSAGARALTRPGPLPSQPLPLRRAGGRRDADDHRGLGRRHARRRQFRRTFVLHRRQMNPRRGGGRPTPCR